MSNLHRVLSACQKFQFAYLKYNKEWHLLQCTITNVRLKKCVSHTHKDVRLKYFKCSELNLNVFFLDTHWFGVTTHFCNLQVFSVFLSTLSISAYY